MRRTLALGGLTCILFAQQARDLRLEPAEPFSPMKDRGTRWALVIGISSYEYLPPAAQLHYAHRDAEDFAGFLRSYAGGALPADHIRLLENENATLAEIRAGLDTWLVSSARPEDIVYVFFAGHGVLDDNADGYFVAYDSDPQNLHATAMAFQDVDRTLSTRLQANLVVIVADACHTGRLGWSTYSPAAPSLAADPLAKIGQGDRSFLKLLSTRPSERSFEDQRFGGGHGVFSQVLLEGLNGAADLNGDHVVNASETIDYLSRRVPELTNALQHPRTAGTFDGQVTLALTPNSAPPGPRPVTMDVTGPVSSALYIDNVFHGKIRATGTLRIEGLMPGPHAFSADFTDGSTLQGAISLSGVPATLRIAAPAPSQLTQLKARLNGGPLLGPGGAWEFYRSNNFPKAEESVAASLVGAALERQGQACVTDYVESTANGPKRLLLQAAIDAYDRLKMLRPYDKGIEVRRVFCQARLQIAEHRFSEAVTTLQLTLKLDPTFACAYNALGVALGKLNRGKESRQAFDTAAKLTPEWALPQFQIASQYMAAGDLKRAEPYLEKAVAYNPRSVGNRWNLMHVERLLGKLRDAERQGAELISLDPSYAPGYLELAQTYETARENAKAVEAYDAYVLLAPNFADTESVRVHADRLRGR